MSENELKKEFVVELRGIKMYYFLIVLYFIPIFV